jgi:hypothetical protein
MSVNERGYYCRINVNDRNLNGNENNREQLSEDKAVEDHGDPGGDR